GVLVDADGEPIASTRVVLVSKRIRSEEALGEARTDDKGNYLIAYAWTAGLNLLMRAYAARALIIAQSQTMFAASQEVVIDFTTAANGIVATPSILSRLKQS